MPNNLYQRGSTWWGRLKVAGIEYRRSLRTTDAREAARRLKSWRLSIEREVLGEPHAPTFREAVVRWGKEVLPHAVKPAVAARYLSSVAQLDASFSAARLDQITAPRIADYIGSRAGTVTNATIRRDLTALSRLLAACVAWGWLAANPARTFDRSVIRERRDPIQPPSQAAFATVLAAAPPAMAAILRLLDATGMREAEAANLAGDDVLWARQQIALTRTKTNRPRTLDWHTPGGDAGPVLADLPRHGPLFTSGRGKPYANFASNFSRVVRDVEAREREAGRPFRRFRVHDLRHGFAIRWLRQGGNIYALSKHLGHASLKTTEIYLGHLTSAEQAVAQTGAQGVKKQPRESAL
jgi:integrase